MRISDWSSDVCSSDLLEAEVTTDHAERLTAGLRRGCRGDDQLVGGGILVGLGQRGAAGGHGILVPGTLARVVAGGQFEARMHDELAIGRSEEHTSELQSLMRTSYAVFCLKKKQKQIKE